jgi:hypothetical protein
VKLLIIRGPARVGRGAGNACSTADRLAYEFDQLKVSDPAYEFMPVEVRGISRRAVRCLIYAAERGYDGVVW